MSIHILYDSIGNKYCGVNNYAKRLSEEISKTTIVETAEIINIHYPIMSMTISLKLLSLAFFYRCFNRKIKIVLTLHEYIISSKLRKYTAWILVQLSHFVVLSNQTEYETFKFNKPVSIIPIFANVKCKAINPEENCQKKRILFFGNFYPARKLAEIIQAFIDFNHNDYELYICGPPKERPLVYFETIKSLIGNRENIIIKTKVSEREICTIASESLCAISIYEDGLSSKRTSALMFFAMGLPLVTNQGISTESFFVSNKHYCEFEGFEKSLSFLNSENYSTISKESQSLYLKYFSDHSIIEKYKKVFHDISK
jgi:glycosyltransferase involved in cell wall biosynthesis